MRRQPRTSPDRRLSGCLAMAIPLLLASSGCSRAPTSQPAQVADDATALSPLETIRLLIEARQSRTYQDMKPLIVPERAADVLTTLVAMDDFLNANHQLCELIRAEVGLGLAQAVDQSFHAYYLDIFSKYVELLDEDITGETATVSFLVDGHLPARQTQLHLIDGIWRYDPGPGDYARLAAAWSRMARGLRQTIEELKSGRLPMDQLRDNPERLIEEVRIRILPGVKMLPAAPGGNDDDGH